MKEIITPIVFVLFIIIFGISIYTIIKTMKMAKINDKMPRITTDAIVVCHRKETSSKRPTLYYLTFKFESGDEYEYLVPSDAYSYYVDGDNGKLTIQGTRYISFRI